MDGGSLKSFEIVPYEPRHMREIALRPSQAYLGAYLDARSGIPESVVSQGSCWTAIHYGVPIACAGFRDIWEGRAETWAVLSPEAESYALRITRAVRRAIDIHPAVRIEATVVKGFLPGERWAKALGFKPDGIRERYHEGRDHVAFVLLKSYL